MAYQFIIFDRSEGVGSVTLNRPDQLNSFTPAMLQELTDVFRGMERDPQVRAILITGAGKAFCGGEDFRQRAETELAPKTAPAPTFASTDRSSPAFEAFNPNFSFDRSEQGPLPYNIQPLPGQPDPQPQLVAEFQPLGSGPQPVENPRTQPVPISEPTESLLARPAPFARPPAAANSNPPVEVSLAEQIRQSYNPLLKQMRQIEKPIIAAVNGVAAGTGFGLALACDIRYASERARFVEVSVRLGLPPSSGTTYFLPRLIGLSRALELAFQGEEIRAEEALRLGLVSRVLTTDQLAEESRKLAVRLAKGPTRAIGMSKSLLYKSANLNLDQALELEARLTEEALQTQDYQEGLRAFVEKRPPGYQGQ